MKNFIYGDFESKFERTVFKKIPGKAPEAIFYDASNNILEKLNIEKFSRYELRKNSEQAWVGLCQAKL